MITLCFESVFNVIYICMYMYVYTYFLDKSAQDENGKIRNEPVAHMSLDKSIDVTVSQWPGSEVLCCFLQVLLGLFHFSFFGLI